MDDLKRHNGSVHMKVLSAPGAAFERELRQVKSALLYADSVTLESSNTTARLLASPLATAPPGAQAVAIRDMVLTKKEQRDLFVFINSGGTRRMVSGPVLQKRIEAAADEFYAAIDHDEAAGFITALQSGALELDSSWARQDSGSMASGRPLTKAFRSLVLRSVAPGTRSFPLIDDSAGTLLGNWGARIPRKRSKRPEEAGLASYVVGRLEAFPDAGIDEILDVRSSLSEPLNAFRAAVAEMAREMNQAPWERGFQVEAEDLFRSEVAPHLDELRELSEELKLRRTLSRHLGKASGASGVGAFLLVAFAASGYIPELVSWLGLETPVIAAAGFTSAVRAERRELRQKMRANRMLFLFEADRRMETQRSSRTHAGLGFGPYRRRSRCPNREADSG